MLDALIGLLAPHQCVGCARLGALLCANCSKRLKVAVSRCYRCHRASDNFDTCRACRRSSKLKRVIAFSRYDGAAEMLVQKVKFQNAKSGTNLVARMLVILLPPCLPNMTIITHLPTAPSRVRTRGYDQAGLIAKTLAAEASLTYFPLLIRASKERQVGSNRAERLENARKMFKVSKRTHFYGKTVILVDDVITTGASLEAAARVLSEAGAKSVYGLVFCQA